MKKLKELFTEEIELVNEEILNQVSNQENHIIDITKHLINSGGKRLRPMLVLACTKLCNYQGRRHINLAAVIEFIHTAGLLHDDVIDEGKKRHGKDTANQIWGNRASVLVGDFLLARSFQMMVSDGNIEILKLLSYSAAIISQGEIMQLSVLGNIESGGKNYIEIISRKTAQLFSAACEIGAIISDKADKRKILADFGMNFGIAFQISDDILDYHAEEALYGKKIGDDFREKKITLPIITLIKNCDNHDKEKIIKIFNGKDDKEARLEEILEYIKKYDVIAESTKIANSYKQVALDSFTGNNANFSDTETEQALTQTLDFCINRTY